MPRRRHEPDNDDDDGGDIGFVSDYRQQGRSNNTSSSSSNQKQQQQQQAEAQNIVNNNNNNSTKVVMMAERANLTTRTTSSSSSTSNDNNNNNTYYTNTTTTRPSSSSSFISNSKTAAVTTPPRMVVNRNEKKKKETGLSSSSFSNNDAEEHQHHHPQQQEQNNNNNNKSQQQAGVLVGIGATTTTTTTTAGIVRATGSRYTTTPQQQQQQQQETVEQQMKHLLQYQDRAVGRGGGGGGGTFSSSSSSSSRTQQQQQQLQQLPLPTSILKSSSATVNNSDNNNTNNNTTTVSSSTTTFSDSNNNSSSSSSGILGRRTLRLRVLDRQASLLSFQDTDDDDTDDDDDDDDNDDDDDIGSVIDGASVDTTSTTISTRSLAPRDFFTIESGRSMVAITLLQHHQQQQQQQQRQFHPSNRRRHHHHQHHHHPHSSSIITKPQKFIPRDATGATLVAAKNTPHAKDDEEFFQSAMMMGTTRLIRNSSDATTTTSNVSSSKKMISSTNDNENGNNDNNDNDNNDNKEMMTQQDGDPSVATAAADNVVVDDTTTTTASNHYENTLQLLYHHDEISSSSSSSSSSFFSLVWNTATLITSYIGRTWRIILCQRIIKCLDPINTLLCSRGSTPIQENLFFQSAYESYLLCVLLDTLDERSILLRKSQKQKQKQKERQLLESNDNKSIDNSKLVINTNDKLTVIDDNKDEVDNLMTIVFRTIMCNRNISRLVCQTMLSTTGHRRFHWFAHHHELITVHDHVVAGTEYDILNFHLRHRNDAYDILWSKFILSILPYEWYITHWLLQHNHESHLLYPETSKSLNLAADSSMLEFSYRYRYGNYHGRYYTNQFRYHHRLPIDESIVRTFTVSPSSTVVNNGFVHVFKQLTKHWTNLLDNYNNEGYGGGNFAHERMEQLDPFETLRFHIPIMLTSIASYRGRHDDTFDKQYLYPILLKLQSLVEPIPEEVDDYDDSSSSSWSSRAISLPLKLISELLSLDDDDGNNDNKNDKNDKMGVEERLGNCSTTSSCCSHSFITGLTGGITLISEPFISWINCIRRSLHVIEYEAKQINKKLSTVELGIRLGDDIISNVNWIVPNDNILEQSILYHIIQKQKQGKQNQKQQQSDGGGKGSNEDDEDDNDGNNSHNNNTNNKTEDSGNIKVEHDGKDINPSMIPDDSIIHAALQLMSPRDKRTLIELVRITAANQKKKKKRRRRSEDDDDDDDNNNDGVADDNDDSVVVVKKPDLPKPAQLLLGRVKRLLQREIRRNSLNTTIQNMSTGDQIFSNTAQPVSLIQGANNENNYNNNNDRKVLNRDDWYWLEDVSTGKREVYIYLGRRSNPRPSRDNNLLPPQFGRQLSEQQDGDEGTRHVFLHVDSGNERVVLGADLDPRSTTNDDSSNDRRSSRHHVNVYVYVPIAEAISRAQRVFMDIELYHGRRFKYAAFMEFHHLRSQLRKLIVVSQLNCPVLDQARLNVLREVQRSDHMTIPIRKLVPGMRYYSQNPNDDTSYEPFVWKSRLKPSDRVWKMVHHSRIVRTPPQSVVVVGGGPTGLMTTIHCAENCLATGGVMKLYEARDAFSKGGSTFERAQIVRLDARWIAMLRYHLGTTFEDVFIPASGETDAHLGNTLPPQGFVEITIKDLENMLHIEVSKLWSKGIISVYTDSKAQFDQTTNALTKLGANLKQADVVLRPVDQNGNKSDGTMLHPWKVMRLDYAQSLRADDLVLGSKYGIYVAHEQAVLPFKLVGMDLDAKLYNFRCMKEGISNLQTHAGSLPSIYPEGTNSKAHSNVQYVVMESVKVGDRGFHVQDEVEMELIRNEKFQLDVGHTHVVEAVGKPHNSKVHMRFTTTEPYGVCCMQGLKVSLGMHNFGETRWGLGLVDDVRSIDDQNTRIVGDFTKMVRVVLITKRMYRSITEDDNWKIHFKTIVGESSFPELHNDEKYDVVSIIAEECRKLSTAAPDFRRKTLQTRFFETGDNYYVGMEFPREYDAWKSKLGRMLVKPCVANRDASLMETDKMKRIDRLKGLLMHHIDRLWYEGCLETIRTGDVFNTGARHRIPRLFTIDAYCDQEIQSLPVGESFRLCSDPKERYEVVLKQRKTVLARNVEGYVTAINNGTQVRRQGNLTRSPDGNSESKVSLATFPVAHYVNHRTIQVKDMDKGYVTAFIGDEQATPHFMRYSGLTGACINAMSFNYFLKRAVEGASFVERLREYSMETNWSNGEIIQRGTGSNYGLDGFLRPGFSFADLVDYLHSKVIEYIETEQNPDTILTRDWKAKISASIVPRGLEMNDSFITMIRSKFQTAVLEKLFRGIKNDARLDDEVEVLVRSMCDKMDPLSSLQSSSACVESLEISSTQRALVSDQHLFIARQLVVLGEQVIEFASESYLANTRISSELFNEPKPVDSMVDFLHLEAQYYASLLARSAALSAVMLGLRMLGLRRFDVAVGGIVSGLLAAWNIYITHFVMANSPRYKMRYEQTRARLLESKFSRVKKAVFGLLHRKVRAMIPSHHNPFIMDLESEVANFRRDVEYYDVGDLVDFESAYTEAQNYLVDAGDIQSFMETLSKLIAETYPVNSYVQESLVRVYKSMDEMLQLSSRDCGTADPTRGHELFYTLHELEPKLRDSLFVEQVGENPRELRDSLQVEHSDQRPLRRWWSEIDSALRYCCGSLHGFGLPSDLAPVEVGSRQVLDQASRLAAKCDKDWYLHRGVIDLEDLYWATMASDMASFFVVCGFIGLVASTVFLASLVFGMSGFEEAARVVMTGSVLLNAALVFTLLVGKIKALSRLFTALADKDVDAKELGEDRKKLLFATGAKIVLATIHLSSTLTALACLRMLDAGRGWFGFLTPTNGPQPVLTCCCITVGTVLLSMVGTWAYERWMHAKLPVMLGVVVVKMFHDEIEAIRGTLGGTTTATETRQSQERLLGEYTARQFLRRYRFDMVFGMEYYGHISLCIQGGLMTNEKQKDE